MPGNLRAIADLEAAFDAAGRKGVSRALILDTIRSLAKVGGCLFVANGVAPAQQFTLTAGFNRIDKWEGARDTQGVQDGLSATVDPGGYFTVRPAGAGDYTVNAMIRATVSLAGAYTIRAALIRGGTPSVTIFQDSATATANSQIHLCIAAGIVKDVQGDDRLQLELKGPTGSVVVLNYGQFGVSR